MENDNQALPLDRKIDINKILESLEVSKNRISIYCDINNSYYVNGTPQCIKGNEMFEENNYVEIHCNFEVLKSYQIFFHRCKIKNPISLKNQIVETRIYFSDCIFENDFEIINSTVGNIKILHSRFKKNFSLVASQCREEIRIRQTHFEGNVDCHSSTFEKTLDLHASEVTGISDFSGCAYKSKVDLLGFKPHIEYKKIRECICEKQKQYKQKFEQNWEYKNFDFLAPPEMQDTFRLFKDVLLKEGNTLDASSYHRAELYCKEIELDSKLKDSWNWRDWIDKWQLRLYRHTSDHHTDLLRIISWVLITIGGFGVLFFLTKYYQDISILSRLSPYGIALSLAGIVSLGIFWTMGYVQKLFFFAGAGLISTLWIACYKPALIFGVMNLVDKSPRSGFENFLLVLYTLVMILLLFSLQKTARKNSTIPS